MTFDTPKAYFHKFLLQTLPPLHIEQKFIEEPIGHSSQVFTAQFLPLAEQMRERTDSVEPFPSICREVSEKFKTREFSFLNETFQRAIGQIQGRQGDSALPTEAWKKLISLQIPEIVKGSWDRCESVTLGTQTISWIETVETNILEVLRQLRRVITEYSSKSLNSHITLDFMVPQTTSAKFDWIQVNSAVQQYDHVLLLYTHLNEVDSACRARFKATISTSYFKSPTQKELQDNLKTPYEKNIQNLKQKLQEGGSMLT